MKHETDTPRTDAAAFGSMTDSWELEQLSRQLEQELAISLENQFKAEEEAKELNRLKTLMHQTIWFVDDMIKTHTNGCEDCHKKHGAMIALFKDITEEPQWPIDPTDK